MTEKLTLVLGGTGKTGRRVAARLTARGYPVRVGSRAGTPPFHWQDPDTWAPALAGVESVYLAYHPDLAEPGADETVGAFSERAYAHGVRRLVLLSGRGDPAARRGERRVRAAGAEWVIVRASMFHQNFSEDFLREAVVAGTVAFPAGGVAEPFVDAEDIAEVAVAALTGSGHAGEVYEVTGPRLLTFADAVGEIAAAAGRDVRYLPVSSAEFAASLTRAGAPAGYAGFLADLFARIFDGRNAYLGDGVPRVLGRPAREFADYARTVAATGVWSDAGGQ